MMRIATLLFVVVALGACGDDEQVLTRDHACQEQARTWCDYLSGGSGCWYSYVYPCALPDAEALIRTSAQDACLDAMAEVAPTLPACNPLVGNCTDAVPAGCRALWATR